VVFYDQLILDHTGREEACFTATTTRSRHQYLTKSLIREIGCAPTSPDRRVAPMGKKRHDAAIDQVGHPMSSSRCC
jgi:hypothetical protein